LPGLVAGLLPAVPAPVAFDDAFFMGTREHDQRLDKRQRVGGLGRIFPLRLQSDDGDTEVLKGKEQLQRRANLVPAQSVERFHDQHATTGNALRSARLQESSKGTLTNVVTTEGRDA